MMTACAADYRSTCAHTGDLDLSGFGSEPKWVKRGRLEMSRNRSQIKV